MGFALDADGAMSSGGDLSCPVIVLLALFSDAADFLADGVFLLMM